MELELTQLLQEQFIPHCLTAAANYPTDVLEKARKEQPTGRLGDTEEISSVVCFLCPTAYYIIG